MPQSSNQRDVDTIVETLEAEIIFGRLKPRERLIEDALLQRFGAKRYVVRQALSELERIGIVVKQRNKGAMVRDFTAVEVEHIYEMREALHTQAARRMTLPLDPAVVARLRDLNERRTAAIEGGDLRAVYTLNDEFHGALFATCGNPYLAETIAQFERLSHAIRSWRIGDAAQLRESQLEHADMIDALERGDREALLRLVVDHVKPSKEAYLAAHGRYSD